MSNLQEDWTATVYEPAAFPPDARPAEHLHRRVGEYGSTLAAEYLHTLAATHGPADTTDSPCVICEEDDVLLGDTVQHLRNFNGQTACRTFFHVFCIIKWIKSNTTQPTCPGCRQPLSDPTDSDYAESTLGETMIAEDHSTWDVDHHVIESVDEITSLIRPLNLDSMEQARKAIRGWLQPQGDDFLGEGFLINDDGDDIVSLRFLSSLEAHWLDEDDWGIVWFWKSVLGVEHYRRLIIPDDPFGIGLCFYVPHVVEIQFISSLAHLEIVIGHQRYRNLIQNGVNHLQIPWSHRLMRRILETVNFYGHVNPLAINDFEKYTQANPNGRWFLFNIPSTHKASNIFAIPALELGAVRLRQSRWPFRLGDIDNGWLPVGFPGIKHRQDCSYHQRLFHEMPRAGGRGMLELQQEMTLDADAKVGPLPIAKSYHHEMVEMLGEAVLNDRKAFEAALARNADVRGRRLRRRRRDGSSYLNYFGDQTLHGDRGRCDVHGNRLDRNGNIVQRRQLKGSRRLWPPRH